MSTSTYLYRYVCICKFMYSACGNCVRVCVYIMMYLYECLQYTCTCKETPT